MPDEHISLTASASAARVEDSSRSQASPRDGSHSSVGKPLRQPFRAEHGTEAAERRTPKPERPGTVRKPGPPEQTHAENFYYVKQIQAKTKLVIVLRDGEELRGMIEWYDKTCIKVIPEIEAPIVVYKAAIKYMYKEAEG